METPTSSEEGISEDKDQEPYCTVHPILVPQTYPRISIARYVSLPLQAWFRALCRPGVVSTRQWRQGWSSLRRGGNLIHMDGNCAEGNMAQGMSKVCQAKMPYVSDMVPLLSSNREHEVKPLLT